MERFDSVPARPANEKQRHIALLVSSLSGGGAERVMVTLANSFAQKGYQVDIVLVKKTGEYVNEIASDVNVVDLAASRTLFAFWPLVRYLRHRQPEALLATQAHVNSLAVWAQLIARTPTRVVVREATTISAHRDNVGESMKSILYSTIHAQSYKMAHAVVSPSEGVAQDLKKIYGLDGRKIQTIVNPLPLTSIVHQSEEIVEDSWFFAENSPVILGVGRLTPEKDFSSLIQAFARVREQQVARLVILGEGSERNNLESLVHRLGLQNDVILPGFVDNPYKYMLRSAVFVLSSRREGLPNSLLQAASLGVPIVSTDCPSGPREILDGGRWGRLVEMGNIDAIAQAILEGLQGQIELIPLSVIHQRYDAETVASQYLKVLTGCLLDTVAEQVVSAR